MSSNLRLKKAQDKVWQIEDCTVDESVSSQYLINSQYSKEKEVQSVLDRIDFGYHKNFIIFGIRNIELISEIYRKKTPFSTMVIIEICEEGVEEVFLQAEEEKIAFLFDRAYVNIVIGSSNEIIKQLDSVLRVELKLYNLRNIEVLSMPYIKTMFRNEVEDITATIFERLHTFIKSFGNSPDDILIGTDNYLNNWKHIFRGIDYSCFADAYKGKPAIIVGAGPSLDKNIHELKKVNGKALIMCVDAALDSLLDAGIVPDIVSTIERTDITTKFYKRDILPENITFLGPNIISGSIFERFKRIVFTGRVGDSLIRELNECIGFNNLEIGGNVSHIPVAFAQYIGCSHIIFVGMDLAYTGGKTHTTQVVENLDENSIKNVYRDKESTVYVKGQNGELLETFEFFMYAKNWIEIEILNHDGVKYINATEGGANIEGAENMKLELALREYCSGEKIPAFDAKYDTFYKDNKIDKIETTEKAIKFFTDMQKYYKDTSKAARNFSSKISKKYGMEAIQAMEKSRFAMETETGKNPAGRFIIQSIIISFHRDIHSFPMVLDREQEKKMLKRSTDYYDTIYKVSKKVNETLVVYKKVLNSYLTIFKGEEGADSGDNR